MAKLSKKEKKALKKARAEAAKLEAARKEAEKKAAEAETARLYIAKMKFLREKLPEILTNPWILVQEEDVGIEFLDAYSLAVRNSKYHMYHMAFPPVEVEEPEEEEEEEVKDEGVKEEEKKGEEKKEENKQEELKAKEKKEPTMLMATPVEEEGWGLRDIPAHYIPAGALPKSREPGLSALQQLVNQCNEAMMQLAEFASTQPSFLFKSPQNLKYVAYAARYQAALLDPTYVADSQPDENIVDDRPLAKDDGTLEEGVTKCYDHNVILSVLLNLVKATIELPGQDVVLERIPQFYPPEPEPEPQPEPEAPAKKGKKDKKKDKKGKGGKKGKKGQKEEEKKEEEKKEEEKKEEKVQRPPLPDIIKSEFIDHLLRFATVMHPKLWQEERIKQQEEQKAKEAAAKAAAEAKKASEEESEKKSKKKTRKKKQEPETKKRDPRLAKLQIAPHVPTLVSVLSALKTMSSSRDVKLFVKQHAMWAPFLKLSSGEQIGFDEDFQTLAKEVVTAYEE
eukprot:jgi/Bigna1/73508/fgenesh1_pg.24_\